MTCLTTASILACLLSPSNLEVSATAASNLTGDFTFYENGAPVHTPVWGRFALEMKPQISDSLRLIYGVEHLSVINAGDRGEERMFLGFVWSPFRK